MTLRERVAALVKWKTGKKPSKLQLDRHVAKYRTDAKAFGITPSRLAALVESVRDEDAEYGEACPAHYQEEEQEGVRGKGQNSKVIAVNGPVSSPGLLLRERQGLDTDTSWHWGRRCCVRPRL